MLLILLQNEKPTHLAVAFDISRHSFRTREYPEYKGTRGETPPEFKGQVPLLQDALAGDGHPHHRERGLRGRRHPRDPRDARARPRATGCCVVSGDRDTIQLVNDDVTLLYPNAQGVSELKRYDRDAVVERYGIRPEQYPDVAALVGETSDNLIGITRSARRPRSSGSGCYGSLDGILEHADEIKGVVGENLREQRENADPQPPAQPAASPTSTLDVGLDELVRAADRPRRRVRESSSGCEFRTLLERVIKIAAGGGGNGDGTPDGAGAPRRRRRAAATAPGAAHAARRGARAPGSTGSIAAEPAGSGSASRSLDGAVDRLRASRPPTETAYRAVGSRTAPTTRRSRRGSRATRPRS